MRTSARDSKKILPRRFQFRQSRGAMKRVDLIRHLDSHGCQLVREGGNHTVYFNPHEKRIASVPRHREIKNPTATRICRQLSIPDPERR